MHLTDQNRLGDARSGAWQPKLDALSEIVLPLVSVVVVNYNYGRFLRAAVESVLHQTYPRVECILVDNASTDESAAVISSLEAAHPSLRIIRCAVNGWQTQASLDGLATSRGSYVVFLDADDVLLPTALDAHVYVHLSMREQVGFTSGDMLQMVDSQVVVATGQHFGRYVAEQKTATIRPYEHVDQCWPPPDLAALLDRKIYSVPSTFTDWVWSPTSGNCYRRDALMLFCDNKELPNLKTNTDLYLARGINSVCGSALIDMPLFAYRIHGDNIYSRRAQLNGVPSFEPASAGNNNDLAKLMLIDHFIVHADRFVPEPWYRWRYMERLYSIDLVDRDRNLPRFARRSRVARRLYENAEVLADRMGKLFIASVLLRLLIPPHLIVGRLFFSKRRA